MKVAPACRLFGHCRQAYYQSKADIGSHVKNERLMLDTVREIRGEDPGIGGYKLWIMLTALFGERFMPGRDSFYTLLRRHRLMLPPRKADSLRASATLEALRQAIDQAVEMTGSENLEGLIHHSDRGVQYCCDAYVERLRRHGIAISMTEDYKPTDNAVAERINGIIKVERLYRQGLFETIERAASVIERYIYFYNYRRPHMSVGYKTPGIVHGEKETQIKMWRNKRKPVKSNEKEMDTIALQSRTTNLSEGLCSAQR